MIAHRAGLHRNVENELDDKIISNLNNKAAIFFNCCSVIISPLSSTKISFVALNLVTNNTKACNYALYGAASYGILCVDPVRSIGTYKHLRL